MVNLNRNPMFSGLMRGLSPRFYAGSVPKVFCTTMQMNRREFLLSVGAFGLAGSKVFAEAVELGYPAYWAAQVARAADSVKANAAECPFGFWFVTDPHMPSNAHHSGEILAALGRATSLKTVLCGGDIPEAFGSRFPTDKDCVDNSIALYREKIVSPIETAGLDFLPAKGNHDFTVKHDPKTNSGFTYSEKDARDVLMKIMSAAKFVTNAADPTACYYYVDDERARFRVIVADTTDRNSKTRTFWAVESGVGDVQLKWLAENAISTIPDRWNAVVMNHIPIAQVVGGAAEAKLFSSFRGLLEAYNHRGRWSGAGTSLDFSKAAGRIVMNLTGHEHAERMTYFNGLLHLTEPCDAAYGDYIVGSVPWCENLPRKKSGSPFEHTFDAFQFDFKRNVIRVTRVGGGADRVIHLEPIVMKKGEGRQIVPQFVKGADFFGAYDGERCGFRVNPKNKYTYFTEYFNEHLKTGAKGALLALSPGEGIALARNAGGEKELWPVKIV